MATQVKAAKVNTRLIPVTELFEFPDNPNEEASYVFHNLHQEIAEDGFDQPLIVVDRLIIEQQPGWSIVSGNHRFRACKEQGFTHIDCVVKDWDAEKARIKVVRRNLIAGKLNDERFTNLIDKMRAPYTPDQLSDALGFADIDEFAKHYKKQHEREALHPGRNGFGDPTKLVEGMTVILNKLFSEYGDTVPHSFMFFLNGSKIHLAVQTNTQLRRAISKIAKHCVTHALDINEVITGLLAAGIEATGFDRHTVAAHAKVDEDIEEELMPVVGRAASEAEEDE